MRRKPKSKLPAGWDVYSSANKKPVKRRAPAWLQRAAVGAGSGRAWWKYAVWALLIGALLVVAFYPWRFEG